MRIQVYFRENGGDWVEDSSGANEIRSIIRLKSDRTIESDRKTALRKFAERAAQFPYTLRRLYIDFDGNGLEEAATTYPINYHAHDYGKGKRGPVGNDGCNLGWSTGANGSGGAERYTYAKEGTVTVMRKSNGEAVAAHSSISGRTFISNACSLENYNAAVQFNKGFLKGNAVTEMPNNTFHGIYDQRKNW